MLVTLPRVLGGAIALANEYAITMNRLTTEPVLEKGQRRGQRGEIQVDQRSAATESGNSAMRRINCQGVRASE